jgi:hypothetical protein
MEQAASLGVFGALQKMTKAFSGLLPILILISLIAGVWLYYFFVARHQPIYPDWKDGIKGILRFDVMFWPLLGRILYISISVFLLLSGIITMVAVNFLGGLVGMALLLILFRILFEMLLVLFSIHERLMKQGRQTEGISTQETEMAIQPADEEDIPEKRVDNDPDLMLK